jgi:hypothetical protein
MNPSTFTHPLFTPQVKACLDEIIAMPNAIPKGEILRRAFLHNARGTVVVSLLPQYRSLMAGAGDPTASVPMVEAKATQPAVMPAKPKETKPWKRSR